MPTLGNAYCSQPGCPNPKPCPTHRKQRSSKGLRWTGYSADKRRRIYLRRHPICQHCNQALAAELDHIQPLAAGGTEAWDNLQALCKPCHQAKTRQDRGGRGEIA